MEKKQKNKPKGRYATIAVSPDVRDKVRIYAAHNGRTVKDVVEQAIENEITKDND